MYPSFSSVKTYKKRARSRQIFERNRNRQLVMSESSLFYGHSTCNSYVKHESAI